MRPKALPERAYALFEAKGPENAARVRRIVGLVSALHARPTDWSGLRVLDLGCGEGLFALEAALHGARVTAIDARDQRMAAGRALAAELALADLEFIRADIRSYPFEKHGPFDVVLFLGLMYHLDAPALFDVTYRAAAASARSMIVDTHFAPAADETVRHGRETYHGWTYREHRVDEHPAVRRSRLLASFANESSLWLTPDSLFALLRHAGFPTVLQCHVPLQPFQGGDRFTVVALKGEAPAVCAFPGINDASEEDVRRRGRPHGSLAFMPPLGSARDAAMTSVASRLGAWVRDRHELVLATSGTWSSIAAVPRPPDAAIWRRSDLDGYVGKLRRVPPLLAVEVAGADDGEDALLEIAAGHLAAGVSTVWLVLPAPRAVLVVTAAGVTRHGADAALPEPAGLVGLALGARDLLPAEASPLS